MEKVLPFGDFHPPLPNHQACPDRGRCDIGDQPPDPNQSESQREVERSNDRLGDRRRGHFPSTDRPSILGRLNQGPAGEAEVASLVMGAYLKPLTRYARSLKNIEPADAEDLVHEFLTVRIRRPGYFKNWERSGRPLRRWLMNGFLFLMRDQRRTQANRRRIEEQLAREPGADVEVDDDAFTQFERLWTVNLIRQAIDETSKSCSENGLMEHWEIFRRHHIDGLPFRHIAQQREESPRRVARMSRTVVEKMRRAIQRLLERDGVDSESIGDEIQRLLELIR
jgi:RNA polymerase sigma factor (sigma-70 family)